MREIAAQLVCQDCGCNPYRLELEPIINEKTGSESCAKRHIVVPNGDFMPCTDPSSLACPNCNGILTCK